MPNEETTYRAGVQDKLDLILEQTRKTNGRVTSLETEAIHAKVWRARITGALYILAFIVGTLLIPLAAAFIEHGGI